MNKPKCKLCGARHWTYEEHVLPAARVELPSEAFAPPVTIIGTDEGNNVTTPEFRNESVTKRGRPRRYENNAQRQAAYRQRQANLP